jgi:hypothetical protein
MPAKSKVAIEQKKEFRFISEGLESDHKYYAIFDLTPPLNKGSRSRVAITTVYIDEDCCKARYVVLCHVKDEKPDLMNLQAFPISYNSNPVWCKEDCYHVLAALGYDHFVADEELREELVQLSSNLDRSQLQEIIRLTKAAYEFGR